MKLQRRHRPLWCVRMARRQRHRWPKQSLVKRWTPPASTPALSRSTWNLKYSTPSPAKGEACLLLDHLNLSLQCVFVMHLPKLFVALEKINGMSYRHFALQLWRGGDQARAVQ